MNPIQRHDHAANEFLHSHDFGTGSTEGERRTAWVTWLTIATMGLEVAAGWMTGSMALLADGWHMGTHAAALGIAWAAFSFARRHARDPRFSFGTGKVGALAAFGSAILLAGVALLMFVESGRRLLQPVSIHFTQALIVAGIGLAVNLLSAWVLGRPHAHACEDGGRHTDIRHDHNIRAAYLHVLADAMTSVLAIAALLSARLWGWAWADPLMGMVGGAIILRWAWGLGRETAHILLDADLAPEQSAAIRQAIESDGDSRVTDLHVWRVGATEQAAVISIVTSRPRPASEYRRALAGFTDLRHVSIEVNVCAVCAGDRAPGPP